MIPEQYASMTDKALMDHGDRLWQIVAGHQANFRCSKCGAPVYGNTHHMVGRRKKMFRFKIENAFTACVPCHQWAEANPVKFLEYLRKEHPDKAEFYDNHWKHENGFNRQVLEEDVGRLETYCRSNDLSW